MRMRLLKNVSGLGIRGAEFEVGSDDRAAHYKENGIAEQVHGAASRVPARNMPPTPTVTHRQITRATTRNTPRRRR